MKKILLSLVLFISTALLSDFLTAQNAYFEPVFTVLEQGTSEPLVGANVVIKGTTICATTNLEGKATLRIPRNHVDKQFVVSMAGYISQEHNLAPLYANTTFTIYLVPDDAL